MGTHSNRIANNTIQEAIFLRYGNHGEASMVLLFGFFREHPMHRRKWLITCIKT